MCKPLITAFTRMYRFVCPDKEVGDMESPEVAAKRIDQLIYRAKDTVDINAAIEQISLFEDRYEGYYAKGKWVRHLFDSIQEQQKKIKQDAADYRLQLFITGNTVLN